MMLPWHGILRLLLQGGLLDGAKVKVRMYEGQPKRGKSGGVARPQRRLLALRCGRFMAAASSSGSTPPVVLSLFLSLLPTPFCLSQWEPIPSPFSFWD